jgi:hypothetical protein
MITYQLLTGRTAQQADEFLTRYHRWQNDQTESITGSVSVATADVPTFSRSVFNQLVADNKKMSEQIAQLVTAVNQLQLRLPKLEGKDPNHPKFPVIQTYEVVSGDVVLAHAIRVWNGVVLNRHAYKEATHIRCGGVSYDIRGLRFDDLAEDLIYVPVAITGTKGVPLDKFALPQQNETVGLFSVVNGQFTFGPVGLIESDVAEVSYSTDPGDCGCPLLNKQGKIVGIHHADHEFVPVTEKILKFFRSSTATNTASARPSTATISSSTPKCESSRNRNSDRRSNSLTVNRYEAPASRSSGEATSPK